MHVGHVTFNLWCQCPWEI